MRVRGLGLVVAAAAAAWLAAPLLVTAAPAAAAVAKAASWQRATEVPGVGSLSAGEEAGVASVSCTSTSYCLAGGEYYQGLRVEAYLVTERSGTWRKAFEVPGSATLNAGGSAGVAAVSCASAGNCAAGGAYTDSRGDVQSFLAAERDRSWRKAIEVPGLGALNKAGDSLVTSVSCVAPGDCVAGGFYASSFNHDQAFVVTERNGTWGKAVQVPGSAGLNKGGNAQVSSVSCASAGNCAAGGYYTDGSGHMQAMVVSERKGSWSKAIEVPGSGALNIGGTAQVSSVSCPSAGNCAAGGSYLGPITGPGHGQQAFVVSERSGAWRKAANVPGLEALNTGGNAAVASVSCGSAGNCAAGGYYIGGLSFSDPQMQTAFVVSERNGSWGKPVELPGAGVISTVGIASVSCASAGNCVAGGSYLESASPQAMVVSEKNGTWRKAIEVPGSAALNTGGLAGTDSVSCTRSGFCAAVGTYGVADPDNPLPSLEPFVTSQGS